MIYLRQFGTHAEYEEYASSGMVLPNVSHCIAQEDVHYNPYETMVIAKFVGDGTPKSIYMYDQDGQMTGNVILGTNTFSEIFIDGEEVSIADIDAAEGKYTFETGTHTVSYKLKEEGNLPMFTYALTDMHSVIIPNTVTEILRFTFNMCGSLTAVTIPNSVTAIDEMAFLYPEYVGEDATELEFIRIDSETIEASWFGNMTTLKSVKIGPNVKTIEDGAFCYADIISQSDIDKIVSINPNAFCESVCIMATFPQDAEKAIFGNGRANGYFFDNGTEIPDNEIILEEFRN